jgi:hypothetical protein
MNKPIIPPDTCPHLDKLIDLVEERDDLKDEELRSKQLEVILAEVEYVRTSNEMLRNASKYWYDKYRNRK